MKENTLYIQGTSDSPIINFDQNTGKLVMGGSSLPENITEFYQPVFDWLEEYAKEPAKNTDVVFFFEYLNTSSSNIVMRIIEILIAMKDKSGLKINWHYIVGDYDMRDLGYEMLDGANVCINISPKEKFMSY